MYVPTARRQNYGTRHILLHAPLGWPTGQVTPPFFAALLVDWVIDVPFRAKARGVATASKATVVAQTSTSP